MKKCVTCHESKPLEAFNVRRSERDGRQPRCRACCKAWYARKTAERGGWWRQRVFEAQAAQAARASSQRLRVLFPEPAR